METTINRAWCCGVAIALIGLATPALADVTCTGAMANTIVTGKLIVPPGVTCTVTSVTVTGDVQVQPGAVALTINSSYIFGNVNSQGAAVTVTNAPTGRFYAPDLTTIGGALQLTGGSLWIEGAFIRGNLQANGLDFVVIGGASIAGNANIQNLSDVSPDFGTNFMCASTVGQGFTLQKSTPGATFVLGESATLGCFGNTIVTNAVISNNADSVTVSKNVVVGNLQCNGNNVNTPPAGGSNVVSGTKTGQCSGL